MKIVGVDNYQRENMSDILVCENVNEKYGQIITDFLNYGKRIKNDERDSDLRLLDNSVFFKLVKDDYELFDYNSLY